MESREEGRGQGDKGGKCLSQPYGARVRRDELNRGSVVRAVLGCGAVLRCAVQCSAVLCCAAVPRPAINVLRRLRQ